MADTREVVMAGGPRAGFWRRAGAELIDQVFTLGFSLGLILAFKDGGYLVSLFLAPAYFTYCEGRPAGQTVGKRLLRIRVIDIGGAERIGYVRAFVRYIGRAVSAYVFFLGYLWMLWDPEKQCWQDKFARDFVVPAAAYPPPAWP